MMGGIDSIAAIAASRVQSNIDIAILSKVMQQTKAQQQNVVALIDAAVESARTIGDAGPHATAGVDTYA